MDYQLLNERIKDSGMTMVAIAAKSGMLRETLYNRFIFEKSENAVLRAWDVLRWVKI
ncbi:MAG: hypothetical protein K2N73_06650 [Lachnospiraceae bacterium]|nr:hypothetical protein [Lachnospiraceae bacterium]